MLIYFSVLIKFFIWGINLGSVRKDEIALTSGGASPQGRDSFIIDKLKTLVGEGLRPEWYSSAPMGGS